MRNTRPFLMILLIAAIMSVSAGSSMFQDMGTELSKTTILKYEVKAEPAKPCHTLQCANIVPGPAMHIELYSLNERMLPDGNTRYTFVCSGYLSDGYVSIHAPPDES